MWATLSTQHCPRRMPVRTRWASSGMPLGKKFLFWPGVYNAYEPKGAPILEYAKGLWYFDPLTNVWTQELRLFGDLRRHDRRPVRRSL